MSDEIDPTEVHIDLLRELEGGHWPPERDITPARARAEVQLGRWGWALWLGGFSSASGEYRQERPSGVYITPAGRAALAAYELGKRSNWHDRWHAEAEARGREIARADREKLELANRIAELQRLLAGSERRGAA